MKYAECVAELLALGEHSSMKYSLDRVEHAISLLGKPYESFDSIHVVGTNGKGSTAFMLSTLLSRKYCTGLFTSPHLVNIRERIQVNGQLISEEDFAEMYLQVKSLGVELSFFEYLVCMGLLYFQKHGVEYAVLEAGLGGRLDATKVARGSVVALTHIDLDHVNILGNTREKILAEKLGIARSGATIYVTQQNHDLRSVVEELTEHHRVQWSATAETSLLGSFQEYNAGLAVAIAQQLGVTDVSLHVTWPGRLQYVDEVLFDCAHNEDALTELGKYLRENHGEVNVLFATTHNKTTGLELLPVRDAVLTQPRIRFATPVENFTYDYTKYEDAREAFEYARTLPGQLVVTGSLYLVGNILEYLQSENEL